MLLLYLTFGVALDNIFNIYIPLCFYFIWLGITRWDCRRINLHSTMLLLYPYAFYKNGGGKSHLHSTMLLLYPTSLGFTVICCVDLHSTMLLLYPISVRGSSALLPIYIPLCFYFIGSPGCCRRGRFPIYIPLCFYFIERKCRVWPLQPEFTFHYASTLSEINNIVQQCKTHLHSTMLLLYPILRYSFGGYFTYLHSTMLLLYLKTGIRLSLRAGKFTFHYASTLSIENANKKVMCAHLHSTMLLLYQNGFSSLLSNTCKFTFHYASTLSKYLRGIGGQEINLHSTMLLLYRTLSRPKPRPEPIYIPLCFYFIGLHRRYLRLHLLHLHSTMLLLYRKCRKYSFGGRT